MLCLRGRVIGSLGVLLVLGSLIVCSVLLCLLPGQLLAQALLLLRQALVLRLAFLGQACSLICQLLVEALALILALLNQVCPLVRHLFVQALLLCLPLPLLPGLLLWCGWRDGLMSLTVSHHEHWLRRNTFGCRAALGLRLMLCLRGYVIGSLVLLAFGPLIVCSVLLCLLPGQLLAQALLLLRQALVLRLAFLGQACSLICQLLVEALALILALLNQVCPLVRHLLVQALLLCLPLPLLPGLLLWCGWRDGLMSLTVSRHEHWLRRNTLGRR